jgi:hypothetical protein
MRSAAGYQPSRPPPFWADSRCLGVQVSEDSNLSLDDVVSAALYHTFVDVRGNEKVATAAWIVFTRANAATIGWAGIDQENLPKIADRAVLHPVLWKK